VKLVSPDIILCDISMPRVDGLEVCRRVKADPQTRIIPVIMLTAFAEIDKKLAALEAGADDFVNKPYNMLELVTRLKSLIRVKFLNEQLDNAEDVLFSMARAIEAKDSYTQGHVERVAHLAVRLGEHMGLSADEKDSLRKGGVLHDIGKIGVPDKILNKAGPLTSEERLIIRMHPMQGAKICEKLKTMRGAIPVIRHHHEKMDGSGYPDRLSGQEIPLLARVLTIVDIYDALTTTRSYRKRLPHEVAMEILWEEANKGWWDKEILGEFSSMLSLGKGDLAPEIPTSLSL
jgi:putative two-component system response regulator